MVVLDDQERPKDLRTLNVEVHGLVPWAKMHHRLSVRSRFVLLIGAKTG